MQNLTKISWKNGVPSSDIYDDIYFSKESGLLEATHVFLEGNNLPTRWSNNKNDFNIIETGFGTGLNFFASWKLWNKNKTGAKLRFTSIEKHPLSANDIQRSISTWPELYIYLNSFLEKYKVSHKENPVLILDNNTVELQLIYGDVNQIMPGLSTTADAWFMDGFAPSKNPDMWNDNIYKHMARLTNPGGTFATFTAVGNVRRGLQQNGFNVRKIAGFGQKRHILVGSIAEKQNT